MIRVAAVGDVHIGVDLAGKVRPQFADVAEQADLLLVAGDLTRLGTLEEARVAVLELRELGIPTFVVLGNHDYQSGKESEIAAMFFSAGIAVLEGSSVSIDVRGQSLGVAGVKGFGGGFVGRSATAFGEPEMKAFVERSEFDAAALGEALDALETDIVIALTHYAPTDSTLDGEPLQIHPFLGSYLLGAAIDRAGVDLAVHGHAHRGVEIGWTEGGVHVRNVARPVIGSCYRVYELDARPKGVRTTALLEPAVV